MSEASEAIFWNKAAVANAGSAIDAMREALEEGVRVYNCRSFIEADPICIPHAFSEPGDIEIAGFFSAILAWGRRQTIVAKGQELMGRMDHQPYAFVTQHGPKDLRFLKGFKHRTFCDTDLNYFVRRLKSHYAEHRSLEEAFLWEEEGKRDLKAGLIRFHRYFFALPEAPMRTRKHVATPERQSACKRLNMFLRWMVRRDQQGVDFGLWRRIDPSLLYLPLDLHVHRVALQCQLMQRRQADWKAVEELTQSMRQLHPQDPCRYDFALFGLGVDDRKG